MTYTTIQQMNITGLDDILVYVADTFTPFTPALLILLYIGLTTIIYFGSKRYGGQADFFAASAAASFMVFILSFILILANGIINVVYMSFALLVTIVSFMMLVIKRNRD